MTDRRSLLSSILFVFILLVSLYFRTFDLAINPAGVFVDEASQGLEAISILKTGADTHEVRFPVFFQAINDYKDPVFIYSAIPFVAIFGPQIIAIRLVSVLYGVGAVIMMYILLKEISTRRMANMGALILAIMPWHVHFSRIGFQLITTIFWILTSMYLFFKSTKNRYWIPVYFGSLVITFFTYSVAKMYILPLFLILFLIQWKKTRSWLSSGIFWASAIFALLITLGLISPYLKSGAFFERWQQVQVTAPEGWGFFWTYIAHFSPMYLFIGGDAGFPGQYITRHSLIGLGELYLFQMPFLLVGSLATIFSRHYKQFRFVVMLTLIYPLGSLFSHTLPQATRSSFGIIPFSILTAVGINYLFEYCHSKPSKILFSIIMVSVFLISSIELQQAIANYPIRSSNYWGFQYGMKETLQTFKRNEKKYDHLYITHRFNRTQELMDFFNMQINCRKCLVLANPIEIHPTQHELFSLRMEDIQEAYVRYPGIRFITQQIVSIPNGSNELFIGTFEKY